MVHTRSSPVLKLKFVNVGLIFGVQNFKTSGGALSLPYFYTGVIVVIVGRRSMPIG
jgi:hypothetical protein